MVSTQLSEQHERGCWKKAARQQYSPLREMGKLRLVANHVAASHFGILVLLLQKLP